MQILDMLLYGTNTINGENVTLDSFFHVKTYLYPSISEEDESSAAINRNLLLEESVLYGALSRSYEWYDTRNFKLNLIEEAEKL